MIILVLAVAVIMTVVMLVGWVVQRAAGNGGWTDVFWTYGTGLTCTAAALWAGQGTPWRHILVAGMVALWALRLGTYVALRVASSPEDVRYAEMRRSPNFQRDMFRLLIVQGPFTGLLSVAILFAATQPTPSFRAADLLGLLLLLLSIGGESLADRQMQRFKAGSHSHEAVCDQGLWAWSRHPNYLFEWLGWFAYPVIGFNPHNLWSLLALMAPALMYAVLRFATGVPALEAAMVRRKGAAYQQYQQRVGVLLPRFRATPHRAD